MSNQPNKRPWLRRAAVILVVLLVILAPAGYFAWDFFSGPPKPWYAKWQIRSYFKRQTGRSSFEAKINLNLSADVSKLQAKVSEMEGNMAEYRTNSDRLDREINVLGRVVNSQTYLARRQGILSNRVHELDQALAKIPNSLTNLPAATLTNLAEMEKELAALKVVVDPVYAPLKPLRDERDALEKSADEKNQSLAPQRRELAALQKQIADGKRMDGTNEVALTTEDLTGLSNKVAEVRAAMEPIQTEIKALNEQVNAKQAEHDEKMAAVGAQYRTQRWLSQRITDIGSMQTNINRLRADITTTEQDLASRAKGAGVTVGILAENQKTLAERQKALADLRQANQKQITELAAARKELTAQMTQLNAQQNDLTAQFRQRLYGAKTYGQMYAIIGEQLSLADKLLANADITQQRTGLLVASQAANYCGIPNLIENYWLAARIGEAYLLPNRYLANDPARKPPFTPDGVFQQCLTMYRTASEADQVVRLIKVSLANAKTPKEGEQIRLMLAQELEQNSQYSQALSQYKIVQASNNTRWISNKISWLERRVNR